MTLAKKVTFQQSMVPVERSLGQEVCTHTFWKGEVKLSTVLKEANDHPSSCSLLAGEPHDQHLGEAIPSRLDIATHSGEAEVKKETLNFLTVICPLCFLFLELQVAIPP
jgi:hypothetical protein